MCEVAAIFKVLATLSAICDVLRDPFALPRPPGRRPLQGTSSLKVNLPPKSVTPPPKVAGPWD